MKVALESPFPQGERSLPPERRRGNTLDLEAGFPYTGFKAYWPLTYDAAWRSTHLFWEDLCPHLHGSTKMSTFKTSWRS